MNKATSNLIKLYAIKTQDFKQQPKPWNCKPPKH